MINTETQEVVDSKDLPIEEGTAAANTLHPQRGSGGTESKARVLATFTQLLSQLSVQDLSDIFDKVQATYGPNNVPGAVDNSVSNRNSVSAKPSAAIGKGAWKEDVNAMFGDQLTEEMAERVDTIFESVLNAHLAIETARLEEQFEQMEVNLREQYEQDLEEQVATIQQDIIDKLDQYLDYCVEQWMEENAIAVENSLRTEIVENFIEAMRNTFAEHYINLPDERLDIVAEMRAELEEVKSKLNETLNRNFELERIVEQAQIETAIEVVSEGLAETQVEKLRTLAEGIEFTDMDSFTRKLSIVKEQLFNNSSKNTTTGLIVEEIGGEDNSDPTTTGYTAPGMEKYVQAIARTSK